MKKSELQQIIKEEISKSLTESKYTVKPSKKGFTVFRGDLEITSFDTKEKADKHAEKLNKMKLLKKPLSENKDNYMFFQNLKTIRDAVDEMLSLDPAMVDMILSDGHDWANDHIATSKDDVEEVKNFLISKRVVAEKLKGGQKKLDVAEPKGEITGADFKALRAMKKK